MTRVFVFLTSLLLMTTSWAEPLKSASRWDISLSPYKYGLQGELVRAVDDYRTAVNQTGIELSEARQVRAETDRLTLLLNSRGYYQATITTALDGDAGKPKYRITLGARYNIASIQIRGNYQPLDDQWQSLDIGQPLSAPAVLAQQSKLTQYIMNRHCYYHVAVSHEVKLNKTAQSADVIFVTNVSEPAVFGTISFTDDDEINRSFLARASGLKSEQCYRRSEIDSGVISLFDTGLFRQVRPTIQQAETGRVDVNFALEKRKDRTLSASAGWKSEQGFGISGGWQHRNLLGSAQSLRLSSSLQKFEQVGSVEIVIPSFLDRRNRLSWLNEITHQNLDLESYQYASTATLERKASAQQFFNYGIGYQQIDETDGDDWATYRQLRLPLQYKFDSVKNPFNPAGGWRWSASVEPVFDIEDQFSLFFKTGLGAQVFFNNQGNLTLASRAKWDAIWTGGLLDSSLSNVPETELYKAGGSTSVRGYGYQTLLSGVLDTDGNELGGRQRGLLVNELRYRLNDSWGLVGFWDRAAVASELPDLYNGDWYDSLGVGVRFFTSFAPLRLDVAFPQNARAQDDRFLIYFSLGQAF